jgi:hypothetical protein
LFYPSLVSIFNPSARNRFDDKGNYSYPIDNSNKKFKNAENLIRTIEYKNPYLNKVINFCNENKINCYDTADVYKNSYNILKENKFSIKVDTKVFLDYMEKVSENVKVPKLKEFLNEINHEIEIDSERGKYYKSCKGILTIPA